MKLETADKTGKVKRLAAKGSTGQHAIAAADVLRRVSGVMLLEIELLNRRVGRLIADNPTDRHEGHQPEQSQAMHLSDTVHRGLAGYPLCWEQSAAKKAGIKSATEEDLVAIRQIVLQKLDEAWE